MQDQQKMWDDSHAKRQLLKYSKTATPFAKEVNEIIKNDGLILELGCGEGNDSIYFAQQGHTVIATDISAVAITSNQQNIHHENLEFEALDISQPLTFGDNKFDAVYARLSLHYFSDKLTHKIFSEIARVLKSDGYLCFMCKSVDDALYGQGVQIEKDMYELDGHVRHFFSEDYVKQLIDENKLDPVSIDKGEGRLYARQAAFIKVIARK